MLICLLVVASVITLVITIIIMKKLKKKKVKPKKKSTNLIYQNCGVHAENTERDSPPFHVYVGISRDICIYINAFYFLIVVFCMYVCMHMYVYDYVHVHMCTYCNTFQIGMRKLCP